MRLDHNLVRRLVREELPGDVSFREPDIYSWMDRHVRFELATSSLMDGQLPFEQAVKIAKDAILEHLQYGLLEGLANERLAKFSVENCRSQMDTSLVNELAWERINRELEGTGYWILRVIEDGKFVLRERNMRERIAYMKAKSS